MTLTATDNYPGTSIYFTTNGSTPTSASTRYTGPISIATTTTLKFVAIDAAKNPSTIGAETYTIASVPPAGGGLPAGWQTQDIGAVGIAGNASFASGTYSLTGAGADIWGTADALRYAYTTLNGDGQVTARVVTEQNVNVWTKAGVMIRDSLAPGSAHALMLVSPGKGNAFQRRVSTNGVSTNTPGAFVTAPYWVRLTRAGNAITASQSADGTTWTVVGTDTIALAPTVLVGLAVSSHSTAAAATATFDNVVVETTVPTWSNQDIGAVGLAGQHLDQQWRLYAHRRRRRHLGHGRRLPLHLSAAHRRRRDRRARGGAVSDPRLAQGRGHDSQRPDARFGARPHARQLRQGARVPAPGHGERRQHAHGRTAAHRAAWVKIARAGNVITASWSSDGQTWNVVGSDTIVMGATVYIGLANSSHTTAALGTATVDNVKR